MVQSFGIRLRVKAIKVPVWVRTPNGGLLRRSALEPDCPEHPYNWVKDHIGVNPEDFGIWRDNHETLS